MFSDVIAVFWLDFVEIQKRDKDKSRKACGETAVIQYKSAVHIGGNGADRGTEHTGDHAVSEAVFTRDGAKPGGESKSVDISLRGKCPRNIKP